MFLVKVVHTEPYYHCGMSHSGWALVVLKQAPCRPPPLMATEKRMINISLWSPSGQLNKIQAVRCVIGNRTICTNIRFFGSRGIHADHFFGQETIIAKIIDR
uniref:Uncharacterized protein n=1 Tax=Romanomermis culicivorax TaxID=13658 RepID=A0A915KV56_ROMCU